MQYKHQFSSETSIDSVFQALSSPVRLGIVNLLVERGELSVGDICQNFDLTGPGVSKHIRLLEEAGIVKRRIDHRRRLIAVDPAVIETVERWARSTLSTAVRD